MPTAEPFNAPMTGVRSRHGSRSCGEFGPCPAVLLVVEGEVRAAGFHVGTGGEVASAAGDDDGAHRFVGVEQFELAVKFDLHRRGERVPAVGPVQPDHRGGSGRFDGDSVRHGVARTRRSWAAPSREDPE